MAVMALLLSARWDILSRVRVVRAGALEILIDALRLRQYSVSTIISLGAPTSMLYHAGVALV